MRESVNWYFQGLDQEMGYSKLYACYCQISYGNCDLTAGIDDYWAESSLKISPAEQAVLLSGLLQNKWGFDSRNIQAVKDAMFIADTSVGKLYGKTGTGLSDGVYVNGWFVGFIENRGHTWCFAANIPESKTPSGDLAAEITVDILEDML